MGSYFFFTLCFNNLESCVKKKSYGGGSILFLLFGLLQDLIIGKLHSANLGMNNELVLTSVHIFFLAMKNNETRIEG